LARPWCSEEADACDAAKPSRRARSGESFATRSRVVHTRSKSRGFVAGAPPVPRMLSTARTSRARSSFSNAMRAASRLSLRAPTLSPSWVRAFPRRRRASARVSSDSPPGSGRSRICCVRSTTSVQANRRRPRRAASS
jgi:hypothetical protein